MTAQRAAIGGRESPSHSIWACRTREAIRALVRRVTPPNGPRDRALGAPGPRRGTRRARRRGRKGFVRGREKGIPGREAHGWVRPEARGAGAELGPAGPPWPRSLHSLGFPPGRRRGLSGVGVGNCFRRAGGVSSEQLFGSLHFPFRSCRRHRLLSPAHRSREPSPVRPTRLAVFVTP